MEPGGAAATPSRRLLRRLRDAMAGPGTAQAKLDAIVRMIAADMVAEVCSCYVMRPGEVLELAATEGLRPEAVHNTRLRVGEGLVGVIAATARPLALSDAQTHPDFAYRPETGEEIYHSLLGVPLRRGGRVLGVLVVQNRTRRNYSEEDNETLQTVAMVVAELAASADLVASTELGPPNWPGLSGLRLEGVRLNGGLAKGVAVLHEPRVVIAQIVAEDPAAELRRVRAAIAAMRQSIDALLAADDVAEKGEHRDVLETYRMFAADGGWRRRITEAVQSGLTAEAAVQKVQDDNRARMQQATDPYLRERLADLEDLGNRLQQHLAGKPLTAAGAELPDEFILFAREMGPAELLDYDRKRLKGLVLEEGTATSHVAIVARALDIPVIGQVENALSKVEAGDLVVVDGEEAQLVLRPGEDIVLAVTVRLEARAGELRRYAEVRDLPTETRDAVRVSLNLNAGLLLDVPHLDDTGADGIGLFRTELLFMLADKLPNATQQAATYRRVLEQAGSRPVTFRTLDIGGDKILPYMTGTRDENPAMGWRAIRISLDRPALLRQQLRAMIRAAAGMHLRVMFPMVADGAEFDQARAIFDLEQAQAQQHGDQAPARIEVGVMLEVPALFFELHHLLPRVDFVSVGTNDLVQFLYAADRNNPRLSERYDQLSGPVLRLLRQLEAACRAHDVPLAVCGEMAGEPLAALALIGIGLRSLSMSPTHIGRVKAMVRSVDLAALAPLLSDLDALPSRSLRGKLRDFARDHGVETRDDAMSLRTPDSALPGPVVDPDIDGLPPSRDARRDAVAISTILMALLLHLVLLAFLLASWREAATPPIHPIEVRLVPEPPKPPPPPQAKPEPPQPKPKPEPEKPKPKPQAEKPKPPEPPKPVEMKPRESGPDEKTEAKKSDKPKAELPAPQPIAPKAEEKPPPPLPPTPAPEPKAAEIAPKPEPAPPPAAKIEDVPPPVVADLPQPPEPKPTPPPRVKPRAPAIGRTAAIPLEDLPPALRPQRQTEPPIRNLTFRLPSQGGGSADRDLSGDPYLNNLMRILERNRVYPPADVFAGASSRMTVYSVLIEPSGHIVNITPLMNTGVPIVDEAAREMISNCDPFPHVPSDFPQIRTLVTIFIPMYAAR